MTDVRRAHPAARRHGVLLLLVAALVGALLTVAYERYRIPLRDWILAAPRETAQRIQLIPLAVGALLLVPLLAFAAYLWSLSAKVLRAREFPPPGHRVIRDTPAVVGEAALARARQLKVPALGCGIACAMVGFLLWRIAALFSNHAA